MALNIGLQNDSSNTPQYFLSFREVIDGMINGKEGRLQTQLSLIQASTAGHGTCHQEIVTDQGETGQQGGWRDRKR